MKQSKPKTRAKAAERPQAAPGQPTQTRGPLTIHTKRIFEPAAAEDGTRVLAERLWPRGVKKTVLGVHKWIKELAPSEGLLQWLKNNVRRWPDFRRRYFAELDECTEALAPIFEAAARGPVTLLFTTSDPEHNSAAALRDYLMSPPSVGAGQTKESPPAAAKRAKARAGAVPKGA